MKKVLPLFIITFLLASGPESGCDLPNHTIYLLEDGNVIYNSSSDIAGFQFNVDGTTLSGASGGDATDAGFTVSTGGSTVLGFSFSGSTIPPGCGTLITLDLNGTAAGLVSLFFTGLLGNTTLDFTYYELIEGCVNESAINYNPNAELDDGSCVYPQNGDTTADGNINVADVILILEYIVGDFELSDIQLEVSDLNGSGHINVTDVVLLVELILDI